jgi:hypothetical protein
MLKSITDAERDEIETIRSTCRRQMAHSLYVGRRWVFRKQGKAIVLGGEKMWLMRLDMGNKISLGGGGGGASIGSGGGEPTHQPLAEEDHSSGATAASASECVGPPRLSYIWKRVQMLG